VFQLEKIPTLHAPPRQFLVFFLPSRLSMWETIAAPATHASEASGNPSFSACALMPPRLMRNCAKIAHFFVMQGGDGLTLGTS